MQIETKILQLLSEFQRLGIAEQIDYKKFYLYSIITHSTAIEGSTVTEVENRLLFDEGITAKGRSINELMMNIDLRAAYEKSMSLATQKADYSAEMLKDLASLVMKNTGNIYNTPLGSFDSSKGDLRLLNVSAGFGGKSYLSYNKVPDHLERFCKWLNAERKSLKNNDIIASYRLSFVAHLRLVTIHPWADGNGRMSRLVMNMLQWESVLLPTIVIDCHKDMYINALMQSQEKEDETIFTDFMFEELASYLEKNIDDYSKSIAYEPRTDYVMSTKQYIFQAVIIKNPDMDAAYIEFPYDAEKEFGKKRIKVKAWFDNVEYDGILCRMGTENHIIGIRKDIRAKIGKQAGDSVTVRLLVQKK